MARIAEVYCENVHKEFQELYAVWPIGSDLTLGVYGEVRSNDVFVPIGHIDDYQVKWKGTDDNEPSHYEFSTEGVSEIGFTAKGESGAVRAKLEIGFSSGDAVFFNAAECKVTRIADQADLGRQLIELYKKGSWNPNHSVVSTLLASGATTVIASRQKEASIVMEASSDKVESIDLTDASIGLRVRSQRKVGLKVVTATNLTPLIGLAKIRQRFSGDWELRHAAVALEAEPFIPPAANAPSEQVEELIYFGTLR